MLHSILMAAMLAAAATPSPSPAPSSTPAAQSPCSGPAALLATINRPTVGFSTCAVVPGTAVLEEGYQVQQSGNQSLVQYPQGFERFGVRPHLEVDAFGPMFNRLTGDGKTTHGFSDAGIGAKYQLPARGAVAAAFDALYTAPNGSAPFTTGSSTETIDLDLAAPISATMGAATTLSYSRNARFASFVPAVVLTKQIAASSQLYAEYVAVSNIGNGLGGRAFLDYGFQQLIGPNVEIDVERGSTFTGDSQKSFQYFGAGFGLRIPFQ
jgi:hypothetical protein